MGGVDGVAPEALPQHVPEAARAAAFLLLELADLGQSQLDAEALGVETESHQEEVGGLVMAPALAETPREVRQLLDLPREGALRIAHRCNPLWSGEGAQCTMTESL